MINGHPGKQYWYIAETKHNDIVIILNVNFVKLFNTNFDHLIKYGLGYCKYSHGKHIQSFSRASDDLKVVLEDSDGPTQSFMATSTEQGHTHVEEDGGDEGCPGQTTHTSLTTLLAT